MRRRLVALTAAALIGVAAVAVPAAAGNQATIDGPFPASPSFGDQVTFDVQTGKNLQTPWVRVQCFQTGALVYEQWHGYYAGYPFPQVFTLGPTPLWQSGPAECVAELGRRRNSARSSRLQVKAAVTFTVP